MLEYSAILEYSRIPKNNVQYSANCDLAKNVTELYILITFPDGVDVVHALKKNRLLGAVVVFITFIFFLLYLICLSKCFQEEQTFVCYDGCPKLLFGRWARSNKAAERKRQKKKEEETQSNNETLLQQLCYS